MTFILAHRLPPSPACPPATVFVHDYRATSKDAAGTKVERDVVLKWAFFGERPDERLAYATSGSGRFWRHARPFVEAALGAITPANVYDPEGPLAWALSEAARTSPVGGLSRALGFLRDPGGETHHPFYAVANGGAGCEIEPLVPGSLRIIGSGARVPNIQARAEAMAAASRHLYGCGADALGAIGHGIRTEALTAIETAGADAFTKLGITPALAVSAIAGDEFAVLGGVVEGFRTRGGAFFETGYTSDLGPNGEMRLRDDVTGEAQEIRGMGEVGKGGGTLDPERRTEGDSLSALFPAADRVYVLTQAVERPDRLLEGASGLAEAIPGLRPDRTPALFSRPSVHRLLHAVGFTGVSRLEDRRLMAHERRESVPEQELMRYPAGELRFYLPPEEREELERDALGRLFDDAWLRARVPGYEQSLDTARAGGGPE